MNIVLAAAECRGLAKVGGLGDAVLDLGRALANKGHRVRLLLPHYDCIPLATVAALKPEWCGTFRVDFEGGIHDAGRSRVFLGPLEVHLLKASWFSGDYGEVYIDSARRGRGPYEDDARRFAFFCAACAHLLATDPEWRDVDVVHGHDWHTGLLMWLRRQDPRFGPCDWPTVFTVHNLDYQGVRPFSGLGGGADVHSWFPHLARELRPSAWEAARDPASPACFNLLRAGITQAGAVTTVSPTYAREVQKADKPEEGFFGGRGLEGDLAKRARERRFLGWLNGLDYTENDPGLLDPPYARPGADPVLAKQIHKARLGETLQALLPELASPDGPALAARLARGEVPPANRPLVLTVSRLTGQKINLLFEENLFGPVWRQLLDRDLTWVILGTGDREGDFDEAAAHPRVWRIRAFHPELSRRLFAAADLFLMPSDFEPCGLAQLQALRYGALPLVHRRGGLADTVQDGRTGFSFGGHSRSQQAQNLLSSLDRALELHRRRPEEWAALVESALAQRFTWDDTAGRTEDLYTQLQACRDD